MHPPFDAPLRVDPGSFEPARHFYPKVLNAQIHPLVRDFMVLGNRRVAQRYCHLHPEVDPEAVRALLRTPTRWFRWGGADLFLVTTETGSRRIIVIETNSCPSGQKSMPRLEELSEGSGYRTLLERAFLPMLKRRRLPDGGLAAIFDKNPMEVSGYAATLAELTGEPVYLVPCCNGEPEPYCRFDDEGILWIRSGGEHWQPIRAAFRYVTLRPWNRIPAISRTAMLNPVLTCLAGGRNKLLAAKAYDIYNSELELGQTGLEIRTPETIWDVPLPEISLWVERMGGVAVVKNPYSNAGQGVYTITSEADLARFKELPHRYDRFIVQSLIGNFGWSSTASKEKLYHVGTMPDSRGGIFASDLRLMVGVGPDGFFPAALYSRRARVPLSAKLDGKTPSWDMLGTNLSVKGADGGWESETDRLLLMDSRDFNKLGLGADDLIEGYLQTVLAVTAIDRMARRLVTSKGKFRSRLFGSLNPDPTMIGEISQGSRSPLCGPAKGLA